jgi:hypothetical protein
MSTWIFVARFTEDEQNGAPSIVVGPFPDTAQVSVFPRIIYVGTSTFAALNQDGRWVVAGIRAQECRIVHAATRPYKSCPLVAPADVLWNL